MDLNEILDYSSETSNIDFKQTEYPLGKVFNKNEFLKDISAMANNPSDEKKYIFTGVVEKDGLADSFISIPELTDQAKYQQFLDNNIEPQINFKYSQFDYNGYKLGCFIIENNHERPYLFKKNVQNPLTNEIEYKPGDGVIRIGTSSRKMIRKDFELIYSNRTKIKDRKSDIKITPYLKECSNTIMHDKGLRCVEFKIENSSNKSIGFDLEARFPYHEEYQIFKKFDIDQQIIQEAQKGFDSSFGISFKPITDYSVFDLHFEHKDSCLCISRIQKVNQNAAVEIAQNDFEEDIFLNEVLVLNRNDKPIIVDLILRSDDFIDGALIQTFEINNE